MSLDLKATVKQFKYGKHTVTMETGRLARQASGAVLIDMDDTTVMVTVVGKTSVDPSRDFFPLTVNYQERTYSAGKIPGGFFKREGRPTEKETLTSRLIDRPIRPLFPNGFKNEVQIIATVMSLNPEVDPDIPAMIGASAAVAIAGLPFNGPIACARVGYANGEYQLNPTRTELEDSSLNLVVAGTHDAVLMVESEADVLSEEVMLGAVLFGHEQQQVAINAINELAAEAGKPKWDWEAPKASDSLVADVKAAGEKGFVDAYAITDKLDRRDAVSAVKKELRAKFIAEGADVVETNLVNGVIDDLEHHAVRDRILDGNPRIDGRDTRTVRAIKCEVGTLARTHGSAVFTRGETQAMVVATLGAERDAQIIDAIEGERRDGFMMHYNFPPFCVGEAGFMGGPKRREIGHGKLAKRGVTAVVPSSKDFPYTLRVVSEITESNGSSSMASVCGTSLALMDAGVPLKAPVAGIAMGLVKEGDRFVVLSDILGDEDHLGDMDFKVAGTNDGITALQMDIKIDGITRQIMEAALDQARDGRLFILGEMAQVLDTPRTELSPNAPRIVTVKIHPDKIRDVIGKGGATIRSITEETNCTIDIDDDGTIKVYSIDKADCDAALLRINQLTAEIEVGTVYEGKVARLMDFGAFVSILPGKDGLVHISQISDERVENVADVLKEGQTVKVKVLEVDRQGRIRLSMKELDQNG